MPIALGPELADRPKGCARPEKSQIPRARRAHPRLCPEPIPNLAPITASQQVEVGVVAHCAERRVERPAAGGPESGPDDDERGRPHRPRPLPGGTAAAGATPGGRGASCENTLAATPYRALGEGGRSPPRPCCPVRHRRPGGDERNSKRPHGIGESGVCASSGVHCVHRPPTSHARSSTAQVVGFSSESRAHEPNRPPCVGALHQPPTRLPARTLRQRGPALS